MAALANVRRAAFCRGVSSLALLAAVAPGVALAQSAVADADASVQRAPGVPASDEGVQQDQEIIVTGTLIRGVAPTGTNVIGVTRDDVVATGAASSNDLLATIPQTGMFNSLPRGTASAAIPINRPNIRNLGASGGASTLVLMNGHRLVGAGVLQTSVDPSIFPPAVIERVEIVPDGGSAIYGSDAIGGVINFVTRRSVDGVEATGRYGFADGYDTVDASLTAGKDWGEGALYLSYAYAWHNNVTGAERDYYTSDNSGRGGTDQRSTGCSPGNVIAGGIPFALPAFSIGLNQCDLTDYDDIYPRETRHSVFGSLNQRLSDALEIDLTGYFSQRRTRVQTAQTTTSGSVTALNPYFTSIAGEVEQTVSFGYADVFGPANVSPQKFDSFGVTPTLTWSPGGSWEVRFQGNYGHSYNEVSERLLNTSAITSALAGTTTATALNPYAPGSSAPGVLDLISDYENYNVSKQDLAEFRVTGDGSLFALPGGDVRLALGAEYHYEEVNAAASTGRVGRRMNYVTAQGSRDVKSVFGELLVPVFGPGNGSAGLRALDLSASLRYDSYSDFGDTTNPKVGFTYRPVSGLAVRGNWGTSFHAPSLLDTTAAVDTRVQVIPFSPFRAAGSSPLDIIRPTVILAGGNPDLEPEEADTWSLGVDFNPAFLRGFSASVTYFNIDFVGAVAVPPFTSGPAFFANPTYADYFILNPSLAQLQSAAGSMRIDGVPSLAVLYLSPLTPYTLIDARRQNLNSLKVDGLDFTVNYLAETGFGSVNAGIAGTYTLNRESQSDPTAPTVDELEYGFPGRLAFVASLGAKIGGFAAQARYNYTQGYSQRPGILPDEVDSFTPVDLFLSYELENLGFLQGEALTVNVDNLFDEDPSFGDTPTGVAFGGTLGRVVSFGIRTRF